MGNNVIEETVDIYKLPKPRFSEEEINEVQITIGDLHGNAMKLLFMLAKR